MILDVQGPAGLVKTRIPNQSISTDKVVKLKYFHFPDLPLLDSFVAAVTVNGNAKTIPAVSSIQELVGELDAIVDGGLRIFHAWWDGYELEVCTKASAVTLSGDFATLLKMETALAANTCYSSSLFENVISLYSHYAVCVGDVRGFYTGDGGYNEVIAKVRRDGGVAVHAHSFRRPLSALDVYVTVVKRDGTIVPYTSPEIWSLGLLIG